VDALIERSLAGIKVTEIKAGDQFLNQDEEIIAELL